jgi:DNA-binding transcriptional regulator LsrR (DeoR family)
MATRAFGTPLKVELASGELVQLFGIAVGADKAKAVVGAARAGLINTLVTDTVTARAIAALLD